jgi:hypothetical protein
MSHNGVVERRSRWPRAERLEKVYADPLRIRVLGECNLRAMSPRGFYEEFGYATLPKVEQAFELLTQFEWLEPAQEWNSAGFDPLDRLYRGTEPAIVDDSTWGELPDSTRALVGGRVVETFLTRVKEAQKAGTITGRPDGHLSWLALELDAQAWNGIIDRLDALFGFISAEHERARARMAESGEEPIPATLGLLAFESPPRPVKAR